MNKVIVEETVNTPLIILDPESGYFSVTGKSYPENAKRFYKPILDWFESFDPPSNRSYCFDFRLDYVNSSSFITLLQMIKCLNKKFSQGMKIDINWKYDKDDDDIRKMGEDFKKLVDIPFNLAIN
ncbi:MAG: DUF1987 domain-containing protein [Flavobacteriales bacterium]|nr:DUF1987 domain-containing protein [Flavobacteriales bacterium]